MTPSTLAALLFAADQKSTVQGTRGSWHADGKQRCLDLAEVACEAFAEVMLDAARYRWRYKNPSTDAVLDADMAAAAERAG